MCNRAWCRQQALDVLHSQQRFSEVQVQILPDTNQDEADLFLSAVHWMKLMN
jgi:hypothetical protein